MSWLELSKKLRYSNWSKIVTISYNNKKTFLVPSISYSLRQKVKGNKDRHEVFTLYFPMSNR